MTQKMRYNNVLSRPGIGIKELAEVDLKLGSFLADYDKESIEQAEILMKYEGYCKGKRRMRIS